MPLETKVISLPVSGGLSDDVDSLNASGTLLRAENVRFTRDGAVEKRRGHTLVCTSTGVTGGFGVTGTANTTEGRLIANRDRLLWMDGEAIHQYAVGADTFSTKCLAPKFSGTSQSAAGTNKVIAHLDQCTGFNASAREYHVVAYSEQQTNGSWGGSVFAKVFDVTTGAEVNTTGAVSGTADNTYQLNSTSLDAHNVQVVAIGSSQDIILACWADQNSNTIYYRALDLDTMVWGSEGTIANDNIVSVVSNRFDLKPMGTYAVMCYQTSGYIVKAMRIDMANSTALSATTAINLLDLSATTTLASGFGVTPSIVGQTAPTIWCTWGYYDGTRNIAVTRAVTVSGFTAVGAGPTTIKQYAGSTAANMEYFVSSSSAIDDGDTTKAKCAFTLLTGADGGNTGSSGSLGHVSYVTSCFELVNTAGVITSSAHAYWLRTKLVSTPFKKGNRWFVVAQREPGWHVDTPAGTTYFNIFGNDSATSTISGTVANTSTYFVLDLVNGVEDANFFARQTFMVGDNSLSWTAIASFWYAYRYVTQFVRADKLKFECNVWDALQLRSSAHTVTLTTSDKYRYQSYSSQEGAYISSGLPGYMDSRCFSPCGTPYEPGYIARTFGGGDAVEAGSSAAVVYEVVDNDGNVTRSPASSVHAIDNGTALNISLYAPYCMSGWDAINSKNRAGYSATGNTHCVFYVGDTAESMYELARVEMPPGYVSSTYWGSTTVSTTVTAVPSSAVDGKQFIYTQGDVLDQALPPAAIGMVCYRNRLVLLDHTRRTLRFSHPMVPGEKTAWSDDITLDIPFDGEALGVVGSNLIVFGKSVIGTTSGDGPNITGDGDTFQEIEILPYSVGCRTPRSVVSTPVGLMFQGGSGIYLLDGSLGLKFVGERIIDQLPATNEVTSAIVHPIETSVMFTYGTNRYVYDYRLDRWSLDTMSSLGTIISQAVVGDTVYLLTSAGKVYKEDRNTYLDDSNWVSWLVEFPSVRPAGVQGQSRLRAVGVLGNAYSASDITISVCFDDQLQSLVPVFNANCVKTFENVSDTPLNLQAYPARQLGRSFRVRVEDDSPTGGTVGTGQGMTLSGLALTVGVYSGMNRLDSGSRK